MRILTLCALLLTASCASQVIESNGNTIVAKDDVGRIKAERIVSAFLAQGGRFNIEGKLSVRRLDAVQRARGDDSPFALALHGVVCNAQYYVYHSRDPLCIVSARVIEDYNNDECELRFGEYVQICEPPPSDSSSDRPNQTRPEQRHLC